MPNTELSTFEPDSPMFVINTKFLQQQVELLKLLRATGELTEEELRASFLSRTIGSWTDCMCDYMTEEAGNMLYWLTELLDPAERAAIRLSDGDTVDDWREEWAGKYANGVPAPLPHELANMRKLITGS